MSGNKLLIFLFVFLFSFPAAAYYLDPPHWLVNQTNTAKAPNLMHFTGNLGHVPQRVPSISDPTYFFDLQVLTLLPSVDSRISSTHPPQMVWAWGEAHEDKVRYEQEVRCCGSGLDHLDYTEIENMSNGPQIQRMEVTFTYGGRSKIVSLLSQRNPLAVPFTQAELDLPVEKDPVTNKSKPPVLGITLQGKLAYPYKKVEMHHIEVLDDNGSCHCVGTQLVTYPTFTKSASAQKNYSVETRNASFFLWKPILNEQLADAPVHQVLVFTNRLPYKFHVQYDNQTFAAAYVYQFNVSKDNYGIESIGSIPVHTLELVPEDPDLIQPICFNATAEVNSTDLYLVPYPVQERGEPSAFQYFLMVNYSDVLGKHQFESDYYDHFHDRYAQTEEVRVRKLARLQIFPANVSVAPEEKALLLLLTDDAGLPLANLPLQVRINSAEQTLRTDRNGLARLPLPASQEAQEITATFAGTDSYRSASAAYHLPATWQPFGISNSIFCFPLAFAGLLLFLVFRGFLPLPFLERKAKAKP